VIEKAEMAGKAEGTVQSDAGSVGFPTASRHLRVGIVLQSCEKVPKNKKKDRLLAIFSFERLDS